MFSVRRAARAVASAAVATAFSDDLAVTRPPPQHPACSATVTSEPVRAVTQSTHTEDVNAYALSSPNVVSDALRIMREAC
jgi:hypothetical protein